MSYGGSLVRPEATGYGLRGFRRTECIQARGRLGDRRQARVRVIRLRWNGCTICERKLIRAEAKVIHYPTQVALCLPTLGFNLEQLREAIYTPRRKGPNSRGPWPNWLITGGVYCQ